MHILVIGHTGFKGSWFSLLASHFGYEVSGIALSAERESIFKKSNLSKLFKYDLEIDIRNKEAIKKGIRKISPDVLVHLAAQPLVKQSYRDPIETFEVNIMGTWNILESFRELDSVKSAVIVTTDKVYLNTHNGIPFTEIDPVGSADPYSTSKAAADLLAQSWFKSFKEKPIAIARAGNVIGGGDIADDRLIPDILKAHISNSPLKVRFPKATRPWQHVLDCVNGYLTLINYSKNANFSGAWNFGPIDNDEKSVESVVSQALKGLNSEIKVITEDSYTIPEAQRLVLDSGKSTSVLNWQRVLRTNEAIEWTIDFYNRTHKGEKHFDVMTDQVNTFMSKLY